MTLTAPKTWARSWAYAKRSPRDRQGGYRRGAQDDNTAGWIPHDAHLSRERRMEIGSGTKAKATLNNPQDLQALK